ncbi:MAG: zf-HC2 domain-containing protein [Mariprofundaceae bacterium]
MKRACHQISRLASEAMDRPLTLWERLQLRLHLSMCKMCRHHDHDLQQLKKVLAIFTTGQDAGASLSDKDKQDILENIKEIVGSD